MTLPSRVSLQTSTPGGSCIMNRRGINNGYLHHKLIAPEYFGNTGNFLADSMNNVGIESATIDALYAPGDTLYLKMRVRFLTDHQPGSRGFGWWYKEGEPITVLEQMWFMQAREVDTSQYRDQDTWWRAEKANGLYYSRHDSVDLDYALLPDWHLYEIYKYGNNRVDFLIDGSIVLTSTTYLPDEYYDYHHWIDNLVYHSTDLGNDQFSIDAQPRHGTQWDSLTATNEMVTDFIEIIYGSTIRYGYSQPAAGIVSLREYVNEIAYNGGTDQLWKSYSFSTNGGTTVILVTAKAEEYDGYDTADKLRMVIDGNNYGWTASLIKLLRREAIIWNGLASHLMFHRAGKWLFTWSPKRTKTTDGRIGVPVIANKTFLMIRMMICGWCWTVPITAGKPIAAGMAIGISGKLKPCCYMKHWQQVRIPSPFTPITPQHSIGSLFLRKTTTLCL